MIRKSGDRFSGKIMLKSKKSERDDSSSSRSSGEFVVISNYRPSSSGWAIILLSVTALALGGCGRKAGLDLPPTAAAPQAQATSSDSEAERAAQPGVFNSTYGSEAGPTAPKGGKKKFVLDPLLD
jgi:predicted small lipoprotein YifL